MDAKGTKKIPSGKRVDWPPPGTGRTPAPIASSRCPLDRASATCSPGRPIVFLSPPAVHRAQRKVSERWAGYGYQRVWRFVGYRCSGRFRTCLLEFPRRICFVENGRLGFRFDAQFCFKNAPAAFILGYGHPALSAECQGAHQLPVRTLRHGSISTWRWAYRCAVPKSSIFS